MSKRNRMPRAKQPDLAAHVNFKLPILAGAVSALAIVVLGASAANVVLQGHIRINEHRQPASKVVMPATQENAQRASASQTPSGSLVDKYGPAAASPGVAAAIRQAAPAQTPDGAKQASDAYEALSHGTWKPSANPTIAIMSGVVPPYMPPQQAAFLAQRLPKLPVMRRSLSVEQMAGEPIDPQDAALATLGASRAEISAVNDRMLASYLRDRFGPVAVPPLHRGHNVPAMQSQMAYRSDHQGSIREMTDASGNIVWQGSYDPYGNVTTLQGSQMPDFMFQGMYYHPRSNTYLTLNRVYSPTLGRWLSRDPMGEEAGTNLYAFVGNDPINRTDPLGLQMGYHYGNWGGQGWANGSWTSEMSNFPRQGQSGWRAPINPRDWCYYYHDVCLHNAGRNPNAACRKSQRGDCDKKLADCLTGVANKYQTGPGNDIWEQITIFRGQPNATTDIYYGNNLQQYPLPSGAWPIH